MTSSKSIGGFGVRSAWDNKAAMLRKLRWHMVTGSDRLWVNIWKQKSLKGESLTTALDIMPHHVGKLAQMRFSFHVMVTTSELEME